MTKGKKHSIYTIYNYFFLKIRRGYKIFLFFKYPVYDVINVNSLYSIFRNIFSTKSNLEKGSRVLQEIFCFFSQKGRSKPRRGIFFCLEILHILFLSRSDIFAFLTANYEQFSWLCVNCPNLQSDVHIGHGVGDGFVLQKRSDKVSLQRKEYV